MVLVLGHNFEGPCGRVKTLTARGDRRDPHQNPVFIKIGPLMAQPDHHTGRTVHIIPIPVGIIVEILPRAIPGFVAAKINRLTCVA